MITAELQTLMEAYERLYLKLAPAMEELTVLKSKITTEIKELKRTVEHGNVKATYRKGYERVRWDSKRLDGYMVAHPEVEEFRSITQVKDSVSVRVIDN